MPPAANSPACTPAALDADREIVITRAFNAPPELVWKAWTDPERIVRWFGPNGFSTTIKSMDLRIGGEWRYDMKGPDGRVYPNLVVFREIVPNERLVYAHRDDAGLEPSTHKTIVTLERQGRQTRLTLRMVFASTQERDRIVREYGAAVGGMQTVERLATTLHEPPTGTRAAMTLAMPSDRVLLITRSFDAPRRMVWDAMTRPELIRKWLFAPPGWTMIECTEDLRPGGRYRWTWNGPDGNLAMVLRGEYKEVDAPERAVRTEVFELGCQPMPETLATMTLTEAGSVTTVTFTLLFPNKESRDGAVASGMEQGMTLGYNNLAEMLAGAPAA